MPIQTDSRQGKAPDKSFRLLLIGPPGSGKGTQAKKLCQNLNLIHYGSGDLLREAIRLQTPAGKLAQPFMAEGKLVPDEIVNKMMEEKIAVDQPDGFVMDGYPRTLAQALTFRNVLTRYSLDLQVVIQLLIDDEVIVTRVSGRRVCPNCKSTFHLSLQPPKQESVCDHCGTKLEQREDDSEETVRQRLKIFHQNHEDLLSYYQKEGILQQVNADGSIEEVYRSIINGIIEQ